jgi:fructose 1,6-bisphosphatase
MKLTLTIIKADIGSIGGHIAPYAIGHFVAGGMRDSRYAAD